MNIYAFFEGSTEEEIIKKLFQGIEQIKAEGKGNINKKLADTLGPLVGLQPSRSLILRDLDAHDGETIERIVQSVEDALRRMLQKRGVEISPELIPLANYDNVFVWFIAEPDIGVALHIATYRWQQNFIKATIDDYVLKLALQSQTAQALAQSQRLQIAADQLIAKVTHELPALLDSNGIPLVEAKDYVRLYAAVIKSHTSPPVFATKTLKHVEDVEIRNTFAALFAALDFLRDV